MTLAEFFAMGGYAAFVWPAYGIAAAVLLALALVRLARRRAVAAALAAAEAAAEIAAAPSPRRM